MYFMAACKRPLCPWQRSPEQGLLPILIGTASSGLVCTSDAGRCSSAALAK